MKKSHYIWLFDPGHGGMIDNKYVTPGKRSPVWDDGSQYFEGVGNREIVKRIVKILRAKGIDARDIVDSEKDLPLRARVTRANKIHRESGGRAIYVSIHSDAFARESARGYSIYTMKGQTKSDMVAKLFLDNMEKEFPKKRNRGLKEANLYVCKNTYCPAILIENFFMTNESNCRDILMTEEGQSRIVNTHVKSVIEIEETKLI